MIACECPPDFCQAYGAQNCRIWDENLHRPIGGFDINKIYTPEEIRAHDLENNWS